jgi:arylsulfatase A-like enzyme
MVDFYPTLADLAGLEPPKYVAGVSLVSALKDPKSRPREQAFTQFANGYSIRTERYRYTEWGENGSEGQELYDHHVDAAELYNLADSQDHRAVVANMSALLRKQIVISSTPPNGARQVTFDTPRRFPQPNLPGTYRGKDDLRR